MQRNIQTLANTVFDLVVLGGGIQGACVAWEATLRGLSVALIDRSDFGAATSANSLKIIHGGLRYLQTADISRMRQSIQERQILMRIAPHLVHPLPVLVPTYGHGLKGREAMALALKLNDWISWDRNRTLSDPQKHIPSGQVLSRQDCQQLVPGIVGQNLTGAAIFHDAQVYNSERLTLAFIASAFQRGATVANYVEATGFRLDKGTGDTGKIDGVVVCDRLTGDQFEIRTKAVVNTTGPWLNQVLGLLPTPLSQTSFAKAINLVLRRPLLETPYAIAFKSALPPNAEKIGPTSKSRMLFAVPWRGTSMIGTLYSTCNHGPDQWHVEETEIQTLLQQINQAYPPAQLTREDVALVHSGRLPQTSVADSGEPVLAKHYVIQDHAKAGYQGLFSVTGVKYTTARDVAQKVIDQLFQFWEQSIPPSQSATTPLQGGDIANIESFLNQIIAQDKTNLAPPVIKGLIYNYGDAYSTVFKQGATDITQVIKAQTRYAIREEMAHSLQDVILRRTDLGSVGLLSSTNLQLCGEVMAQELGWSMAQKQAEMHSLDSINPITVTA